MRESFLNLEIPMTSNIFLDPMKNAQNAIEDFTWNLDFTMVLCTFHTP